MSSVVERSLCFFFFTFIIICYWSLEDTTQVVCRSIPLKRAVNALDCNNNELLPGRRLNRRNLRGKNHQPNNEFSFESDSFQILKSHGLYVEPLAAPEWCVFETYFTTRQSRTATRRIICYTGF